MKKAEDIADNNIIEAVRTHAKWQFPCELVEADGMILMAGQTDFPGAFKNCVVRIDQRVPGKEVIRIAKDFFLKRNRKFTVFSLGSRDEDLENQMNVGGFIQRADTPSMLITKPVGLSSVPKGIELQAFRTINEVCDAAAVSKEAYKAIGLDPLETVAYFSQHTELLTDDVIGCVAYENGKPLASAIGIKSDGAFGIYWVGTMPYAERRGLASACTAQITNEAFSRGASLVTLQASSFGVPVYKRLGYTIYNRFKLFRYAPAYQ